ncbi:MAG: hypothetical protein MZV64_38780 [Ignavibacteriales bacterium]|nr:hypothetical protein [Ignavibacteriales bacterium]
MRWGLMLKGYVSLRNNSLENSYKNISILGSVNEIQRLIDQTDTKEVILALERDDHDMLVEVISKCEPKNVGMKIVPDLYDILSGQARTSQLYGIAADRYNASS